MQPPTPSALSSHPSRLPCYIIYTSGSTGNPKGVLVEHRSAVNTLFHRKAAYNLDSSVVSLQLFSHSFDGFVTSFFTPVISGATVVLPDGSSADIAKITEAIVNHKVTHFICVPTLYRAIIEALSKAEAASLRTVSLAGEALPADLIRQSVELNPNLEIVNEYGVTEASVMSTINRHQEKSGTISIGKPSANTRVYILDKNDRPQPIGVPGELCIAGNGVARGYMNRPQLTAQRFVSLLGTIVYKTGDNARRLTDGSIQFLGRLDFQVKVRGYRIEPGEIENHLIRHEGIAETVVSAGNDEKGSSYLAAYYRLNNGSELKVEDIRTFLERRLPDYMVPAYFVELEHFPVNVSGKVDRGALPDPRATAGSNETYAAPRNEIETLLANLWQQVLDCERVGINDNFFIMGGDSISSIRIISGMHSAGYKLDMKDLFDFPTIARLSPRIKPLERIASQEAVSGDVPLTPIQKWFFQHSIKPDYHFNQSVMLHADDGFDAEAVRTVFKTIQDHHDALRMTFDDSRYPEVSQFNRDTGLPLSLKTFDFTSYSHEKAVSELETETHNIQAGIDIRNGPLMNLGLFHLEDGDRLLIAIHHLVIDGVSWRILFEDIETLFRQYKNNETLSLPYKTDSFKAWSEALNRFAQSPAFLREKSYWHRQEETPGIAVIKPDFDIKENLKKDSRSLSFELSEERTRELLTQVHRAFGTDINDILLTALTIALHDNFGHDSALIALEGHGREGILKNIDISRTIGWFTSTFPLLLSATHTQDTTRQIKEIKETLRRVPGKGVGYGILKYLTEDGHKDGLNLSLRPQVSFNYLGRFDRDIQQMSVRLATESGGRMHSPERHREHELEVSGIMTHSRLSVRITFNTRQFRKQTVQNLLDAFSNHLDKLIRFCAAQEQQQFTPSDFTYKKLDIDTVDRIAAQYHIQDIYPLTPMQEGMLFHGLLAQTSPSYFEQTAFHIHGSLDARIVEECLNALVERYDILRTLFLRDGLTRPLQIVLKHCAPGFLFEDISHIRDEEEQARYLEAFRETDRQHPFRPDTGPLVRLALHRTSETRCELTWSFHHVLMDGWCLGILNAEFFERYSSRIQNCQPRLEQVRPYANYIQWLESRDKAESEKYWSGYLGTVEQPSMVPGLLPFDTNEPHAHRPYRKERISFRLNEEETAALNSVAAHCQVTLNTILQTLWGVLLARYNNSEDVVFGSVVSGRPAGIEGIETMVGLFINTVPIRIRFDGTTSFEGLIKDLQQDAVAAEEHHHYPLAEIQAKSPLKRNLINHIMAFENYMIVPQPEGEKGDRLENLGDRQEMGGEKGDRLENFDQVPFKITGMETVEQSNYDFTIIILPGDRLKIRFDFNANAYTPEIVAQFPGHFRQTVTQISEAHSTGKPALISRLQLLTPSEKEQVINTFNNTRTDYHHDKGVAELFETQVRKTPANIALVDSTPDSEAVEYSYEELNREANRLAHRIIEAGTDRHSTGPDSIVALMTKRSALMIIAILAILKTRSAYLPIDPDYPRERIELMLKDSNAKLLICETPNHKSQITNKLQTIIANDIPNHPAPDESPPLLPSHPPTFLPSALCYVMYTSGSTGLAKGVLIEHKSVVRLVKNTNFVDLNQTTCILQTGAPVFDAATFEIWGPLLNGGKLVLADNDTILNAGKLKPALVRHNVNTLWLSASLFNQLIQTDNALFQTLRFLVVGGEALTPKYIQIARSSSPNLTVINGYGPTENTTFSCCYAITKDFERSIPIGKPINNSTAYVMDLYFNPQPVGVPGELCVGGDGVARGYMNDPGKTAEKFVGKDFCHGPKRTKTDNSREVFYRTGDRVKWLMDGNLEFLGRIDAQVKIRGFRVEPGEIQVHLDSHPDVEETVVIVRKGPDESKYMCAWFVPAKQEGNAPVPDAKELREFLGQRLPQYMIPAYFIPLDTIPLNVNGKVDRRALPEPVFTASSQTGILTGDVEITLADLWADILDIDAGAIGPGTDFFEIGGHSLKATLLVSEIHKTFDVKIPLMDFF